MNDVIVIGGGVLGLAACQELIDQNCKVRLIEAGSTLGGLAQTESLDEVLIDKYYHFYYWNDHQIAESFLQRSGAPYSIVWKPIRTSTYVRDEFVNFDSVLAVLKLAGRDFYKVIWTLLKLKFFAAPRSLDEIPALNWAKGAFGEKFAKEVWIRLLEDKFGSHAKEVSAYWLATRIKRHLSTKVGFPPRSRFGYLVSTYEPAFQKIKDRILSSGGIVRTNAGVSAVEFSENRLSKILLASGESIEVGPDQFVLSTMPLANLKKVLKPLPKQFEYLNKFDVVGVVLVTLSLKRKLSDDYWTTVSSDDIPFTVIIQQNRLHPKSENEIVYLSRYSELGSEIFNEPETQIFEEFFVALQRIYPHLQRSDVSTYRVSRSQAAAPVPRCNSLIEIPGFQSPYENFFHAGYEHIFPEDRGVGNSVKVGRDVIREILKRSSQGAQK